MATRVVSTVLALVMALPLVPTLPPWQPDAIVRQAAHAKTCCCTPCPGVDRCPCAHGGKAAQAMCETAKEPTPDAAPAPLPPPAPRWAVAPLGRPDVPGRDTRIGWDVARPAFAWSAAPPDKVPIA